MEAHLVTDRTFEGKSQVPLKGTDWSQSKDAISKSSCLAVCNILAIKKEVASYCSPCNCLRYLDSSYRCFCHSVPYRSCCSHCCIPCCSPADDDCRSHFAKEASQKTELTLSFGSHPCINRASLDCRYLCLNLYFNLFVNPHDHCCSFTEVDYG